MPSGRGLDGPGPGPGPAVGLAAARGARSLSLEKTQKILLRVMKSENFSKNARTRETFYKNDSILLFAPVITFSI